MTDKAIMMIDKINGYLKQNTDDKASYDVSVNELLRLSQM